MRKILLVAAAFLVGAGAALAAAPFPQAASDLKPDPAARFGALPNGFRYVILPNREPRGRAALRLLVLSGSLEEREDQRGLAHFLEHMAFNGSTHYPPGTLVEYFQRLGMSFGGDTNAYTSFDRTVYKIALPNTRPASVADGLRVFADFAGGLLLKPEMIQKERGIILSEKRDRDSVDYRQFVASFEFLLGDSLFPRRLPIGLKPVIEGAQRDRFADLYDTWYRPERMVLTVVGDVDPSAVEPQIVAAFTGLRNRAPARPDPDLGHIAVALGLRSAFHAEPEAPATTVSIDAIVPYSYLPDTSALRLRHLPRDLAVAMLNRRLAILSKKEGAPFIRGEASVGENFNFVHDAGIQLDCVPGQWQAALAVGEQELRRALQSGFTAAELREAVANSTNDLRQAAATAPTRRSDDLSDELIESLVQKTVFTHPSADLALLAPALARVTPGDCAQALRLAFGAPGRYVLVSGNAVIPGDPVAAIVRAYERSRSVAVKPPEARSDAAFGYTDFGPPGRLTAQRHVGDLDLTLATFANGVRANIKKTDFETHRIRLRVRVGAGRLVERADQPGLAFFSNLTFAAGGLGRHSADDLERILAGRTVSLQFSTGDDALVFGASTNREDLLLQLQLITAFLTDPGYRPEALRVARKDLDEMYNQLDHVTEGPLETEIPRLLASGDTRFGLPPRSVVQSRTLREEEAWLAPQFATGPIEIGIVGDVEPAEALAAVARTLGALPPRAPKPAYAAERRVRFPAEPFARNLAVPSEIPKAVVALYWPTSDARDIRRTRRLGLLAEVFNDRLRVKIREQLGGAYSPEAASEPSDTFTDYGTLLVEILVAPDRAQEIARSALAIAGDLRANGVTPDELDRAKKPILTSIRETVRTNPYWLGAVLSSCQEFPQRLDWARSRQTDIESITKADLDALARAYLAPEKAFRVIVRPESLKPAG
jgi:zinc protease